MPVPATPLRSRGLPAQAGPGIVARGLRLAVHAYRLLISPVLGPRCRYAPSCSAYALEALERHGAWRGGRLALRRILSCHPWGGSGFDPVPPTQPPDRGGTAAERHRSPSAT
ncbi:MAG TPA: membrane protein insertion efficiency factor YidD [Geminicoccaceae bacterium]|nr:membrane protein insertion efficiency factor YidD [Geminicoccus sp.]HMU48607.1 membrane protein insertion efficiency factor YidD [Geminicoccaceae bacterium]